MTSNVLRRRANAKDASQAEDMLNEDPFEDWGQDRMNDAVTELYSEAGFRYIDQSVFRKGAALAQDPDASSKPGADFDEVEKRYLKWERGPQDGRQRFLFDSSRVDQFRQPWTLWFLVIFCSFGAAVQGWDESVINGGKFRDLEDELMTKVLVAQLYYVTDLKLETHPYRDVLLGLINGAPYLCCTISCW